MSKNALSKGTVMAGSHAEVKHEYHLVDPSPWPIMAAFSLFLITFGVTMALHDMASWIWPLGAAGLFYTVYVWWRDVVREARAGFHTPVVSLHLRYGMVLFIASEVMFFVAWFWAYFNAAVYPTEAMGGVWPPVGVQTFDPWHLPFINTLILLLSGTTVTWAHHALLENNRTGLRNGLLCTIGLGALFTAVQIFEYTHAGFGFSDGIYSSAFYMATGFHGAHVLIGTIFLFVCLMRALKGDFTPKQHFGFEAAAWYWHFVDVVWVFLFAVIYVGSYAGGGN
jgi:cytochrome c oxidase subunit 3